MALRRASLACRLLLALAAAVPQCAGASAAAPWQVQLEAGVLGQWQRAPLVRLTPQGTLIRLPGLDRRRGALWHLGAQAQGELAARAPCSATLSAQISTEQAPGGRSGSHGRDFELMLASAQPVLHCSLGSSSVGVGWQQQRIDVAGGKFRSARGVQLDWTLSEGDNHWTAIVEGAHWRHPADFRDLDATATTMLVQRHVAAVDAGSGTLDLAAFVGRERNRAGLAEFSQRSVTLQATWGQRVGALDGTLGLLWQRARYAGSAFDAVARRADRAIGLDASLSRPLTPELTLRLEAAWMRGRSNTPLYDQDQRQAMLLLQWSR
jgi:hypothetical protein